MMVGRAKIIAICETRLMPQLKMTKGGFKGILGLLNAFTNFNVQQRSFGHQPAASGHQNQQTHLPICKHSQKCEGACESNRVCT